ncbi:hypothetical protein ACIP98_23595 [Streptomyces sp. NPDC088354]|uniref:hypothetical protein n=1 Tax=unclassified Streptomyces TaxID=2593676 RepID=UPI0029B98036|nr:hypothetical protein [Streptomyces sp. MI02-7b]MDX3072953.1 hypothetical protein [Streptomyces sp. MI02-7b]
MGLPPGHAAFAETVLPVCEPYGLVFAGSHAVHAHGLRGAPSRHLDLVTFSSTSVGRIAAALEAACTAAGYEVADLPRTPLSAQFTAALPGALAYTVHVAKEPLSHPPVLLGLGLSRPVPVVALEDCAALKVAALVDRALPGDLVDVRAMSAWFAPGELLSMAVRRDEDFEPAALADRLDKLVGADDRLFAARGLEPGEVAELKRWAFAWAQDIRLDLMEGMEHPDDLYDM